MAGLGLLAAAASSTPDGSPRARTKSSTADRATPRNSRKIPRPLLVYFSRAGENYHNGGRIDLAVGNTATVAGVIADIIDVDVYEIRAADPYPDDYEATVRRNVEEQEADARPSIAGRLPDLERYDTILLGSGVWNVRAPMIMQTFVGSYDFTGRTILPFVTYAVSGMGSVAEEYAQKLPGATVGQGLAVRGEEATQARREVEDWLRRSRLLR
jgi:flavodoxin